MKQSPPIRKPGYCLVILLMFSAVTTSAQDSLLLNSAVKDTALPAPSPRFRNGMLLIPLTMIGYGAISLGNHELKSFNNEVKEELWMERNHRSTNIDNYLQWAPAASVYALNAIGIKGKHNFKDRTIIYGMSMAIMSGTVFATKRLSKQLRPDDSDNQSFPSGHTANAFAGAEFLRREYWNVSPWYGVAGYAAAGLTGYLRMYNNRHWLSDVVAGAGVGILSTNLAYFLYPRVQKLFSNKKPGANIVTPFYQQGAVGLSYTHHF